MRSALLPMMAAIRFGGNLLNDNFNQIFIFMKNLFLFLIPFLMISVNGNSQNVIDVDVAKRKEYMIETYKINAKKADAYEKLRIGLLRENDKLKEQKMTSSQFMHIPADTRSAFPVISVQSPVSIQCCWQS